MLKVAILSLSTMFHGFHRYFEILFWAVRRIFTIFLSRFFSVNASDAAEV